MSDTYDEIKNARNLISNQSYGILSTHSVSQQGFPFGSLVPYSIDNNGQLIILISDIAEHTKNIIADSKVSLTIIQKSSNNSKIQSKGRVTYLGLVQLVSDEEIEEIQELYLRYFPNAEKYFDAHGFKFYRINLAKMRFIGGFGKIYWINKEEFLVQNPFEYEQQESILSHMNKDHKKSIRKYLKEIGVDTDLNEEQKICGLNQFGFDVLYKGEKHNIEFPKNIFTMDEAREIFTELSQK